MTADLIDQSGPVRDGEALATERLEAFLRDHLESANGPLSVEQFLAGYSNLTYLIKLGSEEYVLRRPPFGNRIASAHDMGREFEVLSKLWKTFPPAPRPLVYCEDETVLGAPFYVMERRRGVVLRKSAPRSLSSDPDLVRRLCESFVDNLAQLHGLDFKAAGLGDLGRPEGFIERQVSGWAKRYKKAMTEHLPDMDRATDWLAKNMPQESGAAMIHNDYKYDNLILDPNDLSNIVALLDWEMATIGDPLMDLGVTLSYWVEADDPKAMRDSSFGPTSLPGSFTRRELVDRYQEKTEREIPEAHFYFCYGLFKLAVIVQQIYARYARGHTRDPRFTDLHQMVRSLGQQAVQVLESKSI
jgi:aminoglycoside phosphotransferase (APT) family kinase protein